MLLAAGWSAVDNAPQVCEPFFVLRLLLVCQERQGVNLVGSDHAHLLRHIAGGRRGLARQVQKKLGIQSTSGGGRRAVVVVVVVDVVVAVAVVVAVVVVVLVGATMLCDWHVMV